MKVSIVTTLYHSADFIQEFFRRSVAAVAPVADDIEVVFVDDGSPDDSLAIARSLIGGDVEVRVVELSRNFGHFHAVMTGLAHARGDLIYLLDCDLEEAPELFEALYEPIASAPLDDPVDVGFGVMRRRKGGFAERIGGRVFYRLINLLSRVEIPVDAVMARVMTRRYVAALLTHRERELFLNGVMTITGFRQVAVPVEKPGKSTTTYTRLHRLSVALRAVTAFSDRPLTMIFALGLSLSAVAVLVAIGLVFAVAIVGVSFLSGWVSMIVAICFFSGLTLASLGILGFYLGRVFVEVKERPVVVKAVHTRPTMAELPSVWPTPTLSRQRPADDGS